MSCATTVKTDQVIAVENQSNFFFFRNRVIYKFTRNTNNLQMYILKKLNACTRRINFLNILSTLYTTTIPQNTL